MNKFGNMLQRMGLIKDLPFRCHVCRKGLKQPQGYRHYIRTWDGMTFRWQELTCAKHAQGA